MYKKLLLVLFTLVLVFNVPGITFSLAPPGPPYYGDLNEDGMINTMDAALLRRCILHFGNNNYIDFNAADLDGDGVVDSVDYTILTRYILNIIDRFPVEGDSNN
ncbi:dockerin type I repeat-containing protein [Acetivibrio saccincola]|uniref:Dockerin domain-containing protein n=1 Tax=Acetivibrio saccincola TaxID=1677857 RepID=A0A2S8R963_9FIRM|nr:dockerin type I repeat-containing protein [Acetivibrio saccincola]PQQ66324.1 hypothetical protein B9R14_05875 [Acetivibrio saccincola]